MSFLQSLFSGAKALVRGVMAGVREVVRVVLTEIDNSSVGRAATDLMKQSTELKPPPCKPEKDEA